MGGIAQHSSCGKTRPSLLRPRAPPSSPAWGYPRVRFNPVAMLKHGIATAVQPTGWPEPPLAGEENEDTRKTHEVVTPRSTHHRGCRVNLVDLIPYLHRVRNALPLGSWPPANHCSGSSALRRQPRPWMSQWAMVGTSFPSGSRNAIQG